MNGHWLLVACLLIVFICSACTSILRTEKSTNNNDTVTTSKPVNGLNELKKSIPIMTLLSIGGLIFWSITRSKYGGVIAAANAAGIVGILTLEKYIGIIRLATLFIVVGVIIWRAYSWQKERNNVKTQ